MKIQFNIVLLLISAICLSTSCKKTNNDFYEYSSPTFTVFQKAGEPESIYAYCSSHDVFMDSIYVTSPIDISYRMYYHGKQIAMEIHFLIGDGFIHHAGTWKFIFYGRRVVNGLGFSVFIEHEF